MSGARLFECGYRGHLWRLEITSHQGRTFGNWRKWYDESGEWKPTRDGCTIPLEGLWELMVSLMAHHGLAEPIRPDSGS